MYKWSEVRVLCLGAAGQTGREICRRLAAHDVEMIVLHDLSMDRAAEAVERVRAASRPNTKTVFVPSGGDLFKPADVGVWELRPSDGPLPRLCHEVALSEGEAVVERADLVARLLDFTLSDFTPKVVRRSLIWNLVDAYRPTVIVDAVNAATVMSYASDTLLDGRRIASLSQDLLRTLGEDSPTPLRVADLKGRAAEQAGTDPAKSGEMAGTLVDLWSTSLRMTGFLNDAAMIRYVQCLHALFKDPETAVSEFRRYVKIHTTGLGGMGFNIRYTHGDTGAPGLSTRLLGKVCAAGAMTQLLLTLAHTPGCDVRMVVPATLVGWETTGSAVISGQTPRWDQEAGLTERGPIPLVDCVEPVPGDGSLSLIEALRSAHERVEDTGRELEIPHLDSGENKPYALEDMTAVTALGQMGCITKEEVALAVMECIEGDSRYDVLAAVDSALLLPTQTAAVLRDRRLHECRAARTRECRPELPSVSLGNLGPTTTKHLYEVELIGATFETVERVARETDGAGLAREATRYLLEDEAAGPLRRQILSLGVPVVLEDRVLLAHRLSHPNQADRKALERPLDLEDDTIRTWIEQGWIDLRPERMDWWRARFGEVLGALRGDQPVSRNWFDPAEPFSAGELLGFLYSISGGQRKDYM